ncbi:MAG: hypothetical protein EXQ81_11175, partial [Thermoleophilia bacterium]|nr:hypothetical protein [Thermoleophilia bacterium]
MHETSRLPGVAQLHGVERQLSGLEPDGQRQLEISSRLGRQQHLVGAPPGHNDCAVAVEHNDITRLDRRSPDVPLTWTTAAGYFERLEEAAPAINVASLTPNGQIRLSVVGLADRPARPDELAQMRYLLEEALEQGAWGYSTGLEYAAER